MGQEPAGGVGRPEVLRSGWWAVFWATLFLAISAPLAWQLREWIVARTGIDSNLATLLASVPIGVAFAFGGKFLIGPSKDPHVRWLEGERMQAFERRWRPWVVAFLVILLLREFLLLFLLGVHGPLDADNPAMAWVFASMALSLTPDLVQQGRGRAFPLDESVQAERQDAVRLGCLVILAFSVANVMLAGTWPLVAARAWVAILLLGMLVPQVRLMMPDRAAKDGD